MFDYKELYSECGLCPEACGADRTGGRGSCGAGSSAVIASAALHRGEEPPLTGGRGSGTIFFTGCPLGCPFCQNAQISCGPEGLLGREISDSGLAGIMLELESRGAANINLVTATQYVPSVIASVAEARRAGLSVPVLWNSSGYETAAVVELLSGTVDIWLPDLKTLDADLAGRLLGSARYPAAAVPALLGMADQVRNAGGPLYQDGQMRRGMIMRHLVMPGHVDESREVLRWYSENLKDAALLSLMVQYTPVNEAGARIAPAGYIIPEREYEKLLGWLEEFGIEEGFLQEPEAADDEWIPDFSRLNPFPPAFADPVWHWSCGMIPRGSDESHSGQA